MKPAPHKKDGTTVAIVVPDDLMDLLDALAEEDMRSRTNYVEMIVLRYLKSVGTAPDAIAMHPIFED